MKRLIMLLALAAFCLIGLPCAASENVAVLYLKNKSPVIAHLWVEGEYQGYVRPGEARYTVREGFVTPDSGFQNDGTLKLEHSYAGWGHRGPVMVKVALRYADGREAVSMVKVAPDKDGKGYLWVNDIDAGSEPDSLEWENSDKILSASTVQPKAIQQLPKNALRAKGSGTCPLLGRTWAATLRQQGGDESWRYMTFTFSLGENGFVSSRDRRQMEGRELKWAIRDGRIFIDTSIYTRMVLSATNPWDKSAMKCERAKDNPWGANHTRYEDDARPDYLEILSIEEVK